MIFYRPAQQGLNPGGAACNQIWQPQWGVPLNPKVANPGSSPGQAQQVIGTSEVYTSAQGRDNGIASVKANAPGAGVVENN